MTALPLIQEIFETRKVFDTAGNGYDLNSEIDPEEGRFLQTMIAQHGFDTSIEIGCAYGVSSLHICEALSARPSPRHTIIDPFQSTGWRGVGMANLKRAGFDFVELIEKPSEIALPSLVADGRRFQFALIDGWHTFDHTLLDFFYLNRLLEDGGVVVIDDVYFPGIRKMVRYALKFPNYRLVGATNRDPVLSRSIGRVLADGVISMVMALFPTRYVERVFAESWRQTDNALGIDCSMVALQKTGPDPRSWDWYVPF